MITRTFPGYEALGRHLEQLRKTAGLSQVQLADALGWSRGRLRQYEKGQRKPPLEALFAWSEACNQPLVMVWASRLPAKEAA